MESTSTDIHITQLSAVEFEPWDDFVNHHEEATFFHKAGWKTVLETAFGHSCYFLLAKVNNNIVGILPLARVNSKLFGDALISTPFCVYGGVVANDEQTAKRLEQKACEIADELQVDYLELRNKKQRHPDWPSKDMYVYFRKEIEEDEEKNLAAIPRKQRAVVRKGIKAELDVSSAKDLEALYLAYSTSVRNLGTPVFSKKYFSTLLEVFGDETGITTISKDKQTVSSVLSFYFKDEVLPYYGGGTSAARSLKANDFMYWSLLKKSGAEGIKYFDYGRSKQNAGSYSFKKNWGFTPEPLFYEYYLVKANAIPEVNPNNPKYAFFINMWRRLPLPLANFLGPFISKSLG
ncbi:MAG: peptidoglycan bridge formation protein FemAB [Piscirickettsiaceae bacterium]|nr:MAG: peptidoglycan bridge formation protein FemAB [Piscirickettsiaceae bacterium]